MTDAIGWGSSVLLLATISSQILKQWRDETSEGVSKWLFIGQFCASVGFLSYSVLVEDWVFMVTNGLMALAAVLGLGIYFYHRKRGEGDAHKRTSAVSQQPVT